MRRKQRLPIIFVAVGLVFLLVIALASLVLSIVDYGASSSGSEDSEPSLALPYQPGDFTNAGSGWISYSHDGVEALHGVDISEHQANVDWTALKLAGADYAMIRVGYRGYTDGGLFEDAQFRANVAAARAAGLQVGVYFFSQAITEDEARDEARFVLECIDGLDITWPVAFDWETVAAGGRTDRLSGRDMTACALAFCSAIRSAGYTPAIYANVNQGLLYYGYADKALDEVVFWLAEYGQAPSFEHPFQMWQYADSGTLPGVETPVDLNLSFVDYGAAAAETNSGGDAG